MSFSYSSSLTTDLDWVRFLIGDTVSASAKLQDEEILAVLTEEGLTVSIAAAKKYFAAATLLAALNSRWSAAGEGLLEKHVDDLRLIWGTDNRGSIAINERIKELRKKGAGLLTPNRIFFKTL